MYKICRPKTNCIYKYATFNGIKDGHFSMQNFPCNSYFVTHARNCACQMYFGIVFGH